MTSHRPVSGPQTDAEEARPDVSVLVVNYNTAHLLHEMWDALKAAQGPLRLQTIVVDNASRDDSVQVLRRDFPDLPLIVNTQNVGFGRANNQALAQATGRYVLLLNTDAFVSPDTLVKTVAFMDDHPDCGIVGVKLVGRDGEPQPSCRYFPTPWNTFLSRSGLARHFPSARLVDDATWHHPTVRECDWVPGCYYLVRRELIDQVGLFDPRYFLYCEEVDHCYSAKQAGWKVVYYPDTTVVHIGGESAKTDATLTAGRQIQVLQIESELLFFRKTRGLAGVVAAVLLATLTDLILVAKHVARRGGRAALGSYLRHAGTVWSLFWRTRRGTVPTR